MDELENEYEQKTGAKATYRKGGADYHTLKYVSWLKNKVIFLANKVEEYEKSR